MPQASGTESNFKKVGIWLAEKITEQKILPFVILWLASAWAASRVWLHHQGIPLWVLAAFVAILIPASFGVITAFRMWRRRLNFYVTADPIKSIVCEANWRGEPTVQVQLCAMFANRSRYDLLLTHAYIKGTKVLMHFEQPIYVEAHSAEGHVLFFYCTRPSSPITSRYEPTIVFVDAEGKKKSQRLMMTGIPPQPRPATPPTAISTTQ